MLKFNKQYSNRDSIGELFVLHGVLKSTRVVPRGVDPYGIGGTRPPQYLDWGDIITNVPPIFLE